LIEGGNAARYRQVSIETGVAGSKQQHTKQKTPPESTQACLMLNRGLVRHMRKVAQGDADQSYAD